LKLYSISKVVFWTVMVLILLLPLGRHWRLLSFGESVEGTVKEFTRHKAVDFFGEGQLIEANEVHFPVGDSVVITFGPVDHAMEVGEKIPVYYNQKDPSENVLFNFTGLYFTSYSILPLILIFVWWAFYLSYNNYHKEKRGKSRTPASSPYVPFRRSIPGRRNKGKP
jgi:hypothetical protein